MIAKIKEMLLIPHADTESSSEYELARDINSDQGGNVVNRLNPQIVQANEKSTALELKIKEMTEKIATREEHIYKLATESNLKCMSGIGKLNDWFDGLDNGSMSNLEEVVNATKNGLEQVRNRIDEVRESTEEQFRNRIDEVSKNIEDKRDSFVNTFQIQTEKTERDVKEMIEHDMKDMIKQEANICFILTFENLKSMIKAETEDMSEKVDEKVDRIKEHMSKKYGNIKTVTI